MHIGPRIASAALCGALVLLPGGSHATAAAPGTRAASPVAGHALPAFAPVAAQGAVTSIQATASVLPSGRLRVHVRTSARTVTVKYVLLGRSTRSLALQVHNGQARATLPASATSARVRADSAGHRPTAWQHVVIPPRSAEDVAPSTQAIAAMEQRLVDLVNQVRSTGTVCPDGQPMAPAPALARNPVLDDAARAHTAWQARTGIMSHTGSGGSTVGSRVKAAGLAWSRVSEVLGVGNPDPEGILAQWLGSAGHCRTLMDPGVTQTGVALAFSDTSVYRHFWTQDFARP